MIGRIKNYNKIKKFGFIIGEDNNEYFFHVSNVKSFELPQEESIVQFIVSSNEKGACALDVFVINNKKSSIIILGDVRIKSSNIKNYGITKKQFPYEKIYEIQEIQGKLARFLHGEIEYVWKGKTQMISEARYKNLKAINDKEKIHQPGCMPFRVDRDGICSTYLKYIDSNGRIIESKIYTNESDNDDPPYVMKDIECLYITTYQNDNYLFRKDESSFDINEKCEEIDKIFS
ncbi:cold-shock protein [Clostridium ljungdahlii]|uniref:Cold-shock DNA-binding domain protein n=1 Tax=Clostridium ljungdahlii TaxID=1538 RepID=A0A162L9P9_9CLOT|nr:cold shock domain-containing protein [Clostridium ljungdahlii]OAA90656.1 Cold-shock DNA-binding domain protein [Clostridium ljungdahlii]